MISMKHNSLMELFQLLQFFFGIEPQLKGMYYKYLLMNLFGYLKFIRATDAI